MIKIYYTETQAIIANERTKKFYYTTREQAEILAKSVKTSRSRRENLAYAVELMLSCGWEEEDS